MRRIDSMIDQNYYTIKWFITYSSTSLHKRSDKKEAVDFIYALSGPLHSRGFYWLQIYPPKESHSTIRHRVRARARNPAQKRPFHATKTLALTVFHVYFHHALRSVLHVKGMENHLISNLKKLCDSTNHRYWTLVFSFSFDSWLDSSIILSGTRITAVEKETQIRPVKWKLLNTDPIHHFDINHKAPCLPPKILGRL